MAVAFAIQLESVCDLCGETGYTFAPSRPDAVAAAKRAGWSFTGEKGARCPNCRGKRVAPYARHGARVFTPREGVQR